MEFEIRKCKVFFNVSRVSYLQSLLKVHKKLRINCVLIAERPSQGQLTYVFSFRVAVSQLLECPFMTIPIPTPHQFVSYNIMWGMKTHNYLDAPSFDGCLIACLSCLRDYSDLLGIWSTADCNSEACTLRPALTKVHSLSENCPLLTLSSVNETCNSLLHPVSWLVIWALVL